MVPILSRSREFSLFLDGTCTGTGKNWSRKKVPVPVSEKILGTVTLWHVFHLIPQLMDDSHRPPPCFADLQPSSR